MGNDHAHSCTHMRLRAHSPDMKPQVDVTCVFIPSCHRNPPEKDQLFCRKNRPSGLEGTGRDSDLRRSFRTTSEWETSGKPGRPQDSTGAAWNLSQRSCNDFMMARSIGTVTLLYSPSTPGTSWPIRDSTANRGCPSSSSHAL